MQGVAQKIDEGIRHNVSRSFVTRVALTSFLFVAYGTILENALSKAT